MSLESASTLLTLVPAATSTSYIVTVGPRCARETVASTPNVRSVRSSAARMLASSRASAVEGGAVRRRSSGGSWYGPSIVSTVRPRGRRRIVIGSGRGSGSRLTASSAGGCGATIAASGTTTTSSGSSRPSTSRSRRIGWRFGTSSPSGSSSAGVSGSAPSSTSAAVKKSRRRAHATETGVPLKISPPRTASPRHTITAPTTEITRDNGYATTAPTKPPAHASAR